jgi:hypothetical protein
MWHPNHPSKFGNYLSVPLVSLVIRVSLIRFRISVVAPPFVSCDERLAQEPGDRPPSANRGVAGAELYRADSVIPPGPSFPTSAAPSAETPVGARSAPHPSAAPSRIARPSWRRTGAPRDRGPRGGHERLMSSWLDQSSTAAHGAQSTRRVNRKIMLTELFPTGRVGEREASSLMDRRPTLFGRPAPGAHIGPSGEFEVAVIV